jgi:ABC-type Zn uptake system ZnuABC Zn-binding protein ZnuA
MRYIARIIVIPALLAGLIACAPSTPGGEAAGQPASPPLTAVDLAEGERLQIVATTTIAADVVANVAGGLADVKSLLPVSTDPHTFEPTPRDLVTLQEADVIMAIGAGLEEFLETFITAVGEGVPVVYLSEGIHLRAGEPHKDNDEEHAHEGDEEHAHEGGDPHTWTSPANVMVFARNVANALATLDPTHADAYRANADAYVAELEELDRWVQAQIATIPEERRLLVTDHHVFGYYADRYGLQQIGAIIPSFSAAAQPSARELAALETAMRERGAKAVFVGTTVNPALAERVANDLGIRVVHLYTDSLGAPGSGVETYIEYTRYNTNAIVNALR